MVSVPYSCKTHMWSEFFKQIMLNIEDTCSSRKHSEVRRHKPSVKVTPTIFLLWPWTLTHVLELRTLTRHSWGEPSCQTWQVISFQSYRPNTHTQRGLIAPPRPQGGQQKLVSRRNPGNNPYSPRTWTSHSLRLPVNLFRIVTSWPDIAPLKQWITYSDWRSDVGP